MLETAGTGNFTYGYLGGLMDTSTGLLYMGSGQYYDPTTGRFLSRNAKPDQTNPYVPWGGNPTGALFTPLALLSLVYSRKKKRGTLDMIIVLVVLSAAMSMSLTACTGGTPPPPTVAVNIATAPTPIPGLGIATLTSPEIPGAISTPVKVATTLCPTVTLTFTNTPTPTPSITPTAIDNVELTEKGKEAEALYQKYVNPPIEWWNKDGNFTIGKFLGLMLEYDISSETPATSLITEAVARQIWIDATSHGGHQAYCSNNICGNGALNFIGIYIESAQLRFGKNINPADTPPGKTGEEAIIAAGPIGDQILHPPAAWKEYSETAPYHWGNPPTPQWALKIPYNNPNIIGSQSNQVYYLGGAHFVVYSIAQDNYWSHQP